jgi:hypothetical protein
MKTMRDAATVTSGSRGRRHTLSRRPRDGGDPVPTSEMVCRAVRGRSGGIEEQNQHWLDLYPQIAVP